VQTDDPTSTAGTFEARRVRELKMLGTGAFGLACLCVVLGAPVLLVGTRTAEGIVVLCLALALCVFSYGCAQRARWIRRGYPHPADRPAQVRIDQHQVRHWLGMIAAMIGLLVLVGSAAVGAPLPRGVVLYFSLVTALGSAVHDRHYREFVRGLRADGQATLALPRVRSLWFLGPLALVFAVGAVLG